MKNLLLFSFADQMHHWKGLLLIIFIGALAGALAGVLLRSKRSLGIVFSIAIGILGSWLCQSFFSSYVNFTSNHLYNEIIGATIGALILTLVINIIFGSNKGRDRTAYRA